MQPQTEALFHQWQTRQDPLVRDRFFSSAYALLLHMARMHILRLGSGKTRPEAVIALAYLRLCRHSVQVYNSAHHFLGAMNKTMGSVLIDEYRKSTRLRRGSGFMHVPLDEVQISSYERPASTNLQIAMHQLGQRDREARWVLQKHYLEGWPVAEIAGMLHCSERTIKNRLARGRGKLSRLINAM